MFCAARVASRANATDQRSMVHAKASTAVPTVLVGARHDELQLLVEADSAREESG